VSKLCGLVAALVVLWLMSMGQLSGMAEVNLVGALEMNFLASNDLLFVGRIKENITAGTP